MGGFIATPAVDPNNPLAVAYDFWKDVFTGQPVGTSNGQRIADVAATDTILAGGSEADAAATYSAVLTQLNSDPLYQNTDAKISAAFLVTVVLAVAAFYLYEHIKRTA